MTPTPTDPAAIDLEPYKRAQSGGYVNAPDYVTGVAMTHYDMVANLIAAVEALREINDTDMAQIKHMMAEIEVLLDVLGKEEKEDAT